MSKQTTTLQDAADLCRELVALSRVGLPWEAEIDRSCQDVMQRVTAEDEASRVSLHGIGDLRRIGVDVDHLPDPLRAVFELAFESTRPAEFFASLTPVLTAAADWQRVIRRAITYPLIVAMLAYALIVAAIGWYVPLCESQWGDLLSGVPWWPELMWLADHMSTWGVAIPAFAVGLLLLRVIYHRRYRGIASLPAGLRQIHAVALFLNVLACLCRNHVPLDRSLPLAAKLSGNKSLEQDARELAQSIRTNGEVPADFQPALAPRRLSGLVSAARTPRQLSESLQALSREYTERAEARFTIWSRWAPLVMLLAIAGIPSAVAVSIVLYPYAALLLRVLA